MDFPRISFGIIVLNGEPFLRYSLRMLYPFAHQIIIAEGASRRAASSATSDGHSVDGTLEALRSFQAEEDPERKVIIITAEDEGCPDGFWPGEKDQQSQAYAKRATGDWLWQIDVDEFYHPDDIRRVAAYLHSHPDTTCLTFEALNFWGGFDYVVQGGLFWNIQYAGEPWGRVRRVLKWGPGYLYDSHRPPTVLDARGRNIARVRMRDASKIGGPPIKMYHYFMLLPQQFTRKGAYYQSLPWERERGRLQKNHNLLEEVNLDNGLQIMDQYGTANWLARFQGRHPAQIEQMRADIAAGRIQLTLRRSDDIEALLAHPEYHRRVAQHRRAELRRAWYEYLQYLIWFGPRARIVLFARERAPGWLVRRLPNQIQEKFIPEHRRRRLTT